MLLEHRGKFSLRKWIELFYEDDGGRCIFPLLALRAQFMANFPGADPKRPEFARARPALPNENKTSALRSRIGNLFDEEIPSSDNFFARAALEF